jgi:hypothetical protein
MRLDYDMTVYNEGKDDEHLMAEWERPEQIRVFKACKQEMIDKRKEKHPTYRFKKRADTEKENIQQMLKNQYEKQSINKFIVRDERKTNQSRKCVERRRGRKRR